VKKLHVSIAVAKRCWISALVDGDLVVYRLFEPGDEVRVEGDTAIRLRIGNAGGVSYSINGVPARPLGGEGEAVTVEMTPENYRRFTQAPY
jgi:hypothetical protein